ncbi:MAG: hypothetical protein OXE59_13255 [Bacteroidetes bacterium]|nr:hypothetical protein [Bacteroidota bacterium]
MPDWIPITEIIIAVVIALVPTLIGIGIWIGSVSADRSKFNEFMKEIRAEITDNRQNIHIVLDQIRELNKKYSRIYYHLFSDVESKQSPIHLTDKGRSVSKQLDAVPWVEEIASLVQNQVKGKDAYQIQSFSFEYMENKNQYTYEQQSLIRQVAYDNGLYEDVVHRVLALELRDKLISTMSENQS